MEGVELMAQSGESGDRSNRQKSNHYHFYGPVGTAINEGQIENSAGVTEGNQVGTQHIGRPADISLEKPSNLWIEAAAKSQLWPAESTADPSVAELKERVTQIIQRCGQEWQAAVKEFPEDPWRDEMLPVRGVEALELLASCSERPIALSSAETAVLLAVPFAG